MALKMKWMVPFLLTLGCQTLPTETRIPPAPEPVVESRMIEPLSPEELLLYPIFPIQQEGVVIAKKKIVKTLKESKSKPVPPPKVLTESQVDFLNGEETKNAEEESDQREFIRHFR